MDMQRMETREVCLVGPGAPQPPQDPYDQIRHAVIEVVQEPQEKISAALNWLKPRDRENVLTDILASIRQNCGISPGILSQLQSTHANDMAPLKWGIQATAGHGNTPAEDNTYDQDSEYQDAHLTSGGGGVEDAVDDGVASTGLTGTPASLHPVGSGISLAAGLNRGISFAALELFPQATPAAHRPRPIAKTDSKGRQTGIDEEQRQSMIRATFQKLSETLRKMCEIEDDEDSSLNDFVLLMADAAALPLPTAIQSKVLEFEFAEGKKQNLIEDLKKTRKWVRGLQDENTDFDFYNSLIENLEKRWKIQNRFSRVVANYEGLSPNLLLEAADDKLSKMQADLEQIDHDGMIEFLPAAKVCAWLKLAAAHLCSDMTRDYSVKVSKELLDLQEELARQSLPQDTQQTTQDDKAQTTQEAKPAQTQLNARGDEDKTAGTSIRDADEKADGSCVRPHIEDGTGAIAQNPAKETAFTSRQGARKGNRGTAMQQQQDNRMSKDRGGDNHVPTPHQPRHPGGNDGSLRINETLDLDASAQAQNEQESQSDSYKGQPPPSGKRKHGLAGLSPPTRPADSFYKRPRIGSSTSQAVLGEGEGGGRDDPNQLSSHLRQRKYPGDEDVEAMKGQSGDIRDDGQAKENKDEVQPDENRIEDQAGSSQAVYARIEFALSREINSGELKAAEIDEASKIASIILGEADQSLFSQYIERTRDANTVKDEGSTLCKGTYYHRMATLSLYTLYKTPIAVNCQKSRRNKYLTAEQVVNIIREVFVNMFPKMFTVLLEALETIQNPSTLGNTEAGAPSPEELDDLPQGVMEVQSMLQELDKLKSISLQAKMRYLRLLIQLRIVFDAVMDPSANISNLSPDVQSTVTDIRHYASTTHIRSQTKKALAKARLAKVFSIDEGHGSKKRSPLDKHKRSSDVLSAIVRAFSISCIWMKPKLYGTAWANITSGLDSIFSIIRQCDQGGRVYNTCRSLDTLTMAYTEADVSVHVDLSLLDKLDEHPLECITELIREEAGALSRVVEECSP